MNKLKVREIELLANVCTEHDVPVKLVKELVKSAKLNSYENKTPNMRIKEYQDLIDFYIKTGNKGE